MFAFFPVDVPCASGRARSRIVMANRAAMWKSAEELTLSCDENERNVLRLPNAISGNFIRILCCTLRKRIYRIMKVEQDSTWPGPYQDY